MESFAGLKFDESAGKSIWWKMFGSSDHNHENTVLMCKISHELKDTMRVAMAFIIHLL